MLKTGKIILLAACLFCIYSLAVASDITFNASVDKNIVALDDTVQYTVSVSGNSAGGAPSPRLPQFVNLNIVGTSQSSNFSFINGQTSISKSFIYTLRPEKIGQAHIGQASIVINGQTYTTETIDIKVTKAEGKKKQPSPPSAGIPGFPSIWDDFDDFFNSPFPRFPRPQVVKDPIKADLKASQTTAYVNQQILLTFTFYRRVNLLRSPSYSPPDTTGFWAVNLPTNKDVREVMLNGIRYVAQDFKMALFPTTSGDFTIGPATLIVKTDPFTSEQVIKTNPLKIKVLPLPDDEKPANFAGAVGDYNMDVLLRQNEIERGQPIQITAKIRGEGNIQTISEPVSSFTSEFKKLSSTGKENLIKGKNGVSGSKSFEIVLIPLNEGKFTLPPFEFSYFNPVKKEYRTLKSRELSVNILPSKIPLPQEYEKSLADENAKKQMKPINIPWRKIGAVVFDLVTSVYFLLPFLLIIVLLITFVSYRKYKERLVANPVRFRQKQALKVARKRLKKAFHLLKKKELKEFLGEIFNSTAKYLGDKYNFSAAGITADGLREILSSKGLSPEAQKQLESFISECDMLRFTPSSLSRQRAVELAKVAEELIIAVEKIS
ncbi:MAG: protein BatD [Syntrophaceae bacterium]|nr:protein BatD [Syntrophaceae bacterium]